MRRFLLSLFYVFTLWGLSLCNERLIPITARAAAEEPAFTRTADVIYGRKHGMALTLDVFTPKENRNGAAVIWVVSGGWVSAHQIVAPGFQFSPINELIKRGYTVFAVVHGSQPKFTIPEILQDMHRAVRYIRIHAADYKIDPNRIGIEGGSAGGHLSLMQGTAGDQGDPKAQDPVDRASSRVQAVACFFPASDFLNYGKPGENALGRGVLKDFHAPFAFQEFDPKRGRFGAFVPITDEAKILEIGRQISPINHVSADDAPTLIIHGDKDVLVPIQQAEVFVAKLKEVGVPARLVVKKGAGHGWPNLRNDMPTIVDWFDKHLGRPRANDGSKCCITIPAKVPPGYSSYWEWIQKVACPGGKLPSQIPQKELKPFLEAEKPRPQKCKPDPWEECLYACVSQVSKEVLPTEMILAGIGLGAHRPRWIC